MDWKKFLKPDAFKILGTLILYFPINILVGFLPIVFPSIIQVFGYSIFIIENIIALILSYLIAAILQKYWPKNLIKNEIIKPTASKVLITGIIFVLTIFIRGFVVKANSFIFIVVEYMISPHYLLYGLILGGRDHLTMIDIVFSLLAFILGFVYWYIIASLIVWIYNKFKNRSGS